MRRRFSLTLAICVFLAGQLLLSSYADGQDANPFETLRALVRAVLEARAGGQWDHSLDVDGDGRLTAADLQHALDTLLPNLTPWQMLVDAEQKILDEQWSMARVSLEQLVQCRSDWPQAHGMLGVVYQVLATNSNGLADQAVACYREFARAWRRQALGAVDENEALAEARMTFLLNGERLQRSLPLLLPSPAAALAAYKHSIYMYDNQVLSHYEQDNPDMYDPVKRVQAELGCDVIALAENVGYWENTGGIDLSRAVPGLHEGFMNSEHHRANILSTDQRYIGIGIFLSDTQLWCTEDFFYFDYPGGVCPGHELN